MNVIHDDPNVISMTCPTCSGLGEVILPLCVVPGRGEVYRFNQCGTCRGLGVITSTRGISLPPLIPVAGNRKGGGA